jgi:hypothetical protein
MLSCYLQPLQRALCRSQFGFKISQTLHITKRTGSADLAVQRGYQGLL